MNNLIVLENGLIPIYKSEKGQIVNARELHEFLEVSTRYNDWIKDRIEKYDFVENQDFLTVTENLVSGGKQNVHILTLDTAKEIAMVQNNEKGSQARKYFIAVEKKFKELAKPQSIEDLIIMQANSVKELKTEVQAIKKNIEGNTQELQSMRDIITLNPNSWRADTTKLVNAIAQKIGGFDHIKDVREESYKLLDSRFGKDVKQRLTNKRRRMADEGVSKSRRDKLTVLDVISDTKELIEGYVAIIKEMAIKYGIDKESK
jgi:phage anti-repressor protein